MDYYLRKRWSRGLEESGQPGCTCSQRTRCLLAAVAYETLPLFPLPPLPFRSAPELPTETSASSAEVPHPLLPSPASARSPQWSLEPRKNRSINIFTLFFNSGHTYRHSNCRVLLFYTNLDSLLCGNDPKTTVRFKIPHTCKTCPTFWPDKLIYQLYSRYSCMVQ